jgi:glycosyltransferase involved in cell wall biosynthesis
MHILFLTDNFPPEVNAPASRTYEHCREWVKDGVSVTVITCAPNFPGGKVFPGYRNALWNVSTVDGIKVVRVWSYVTANEGFLKRVLDYISFMFSAVVASFFVRRVDIVVATSPQFFTACAGWIVSSFKRASFVFELRDIWPESIKVVGAMRESLVIRALERLELFLYNRADLIVSVTNSFKSNLISRGVSAPKIKVVTNGVDMSKFMPTDKDPELIKRLGLSGKFVGGYVGTHGMAHHLETILDAAEIISSIPGGDRFQFLLLGDGSRKKALVDEAARRSLKNVTFIDSVAKEDVPRYWSLLDVAIIHLRKADLFTSVIPSKLFECMGMGIPVLHGVDGESAEIVRTVEAGVVFEPENARELVEYMLRLATDSDEYRRCKLGCLNGAKIYDRKALASRMLQFLRAV